MEYQKPIVSIAGDLFRVEYGLDCMQLLCDPTKTIPFSQMEDHAKDYWRRFLYDTEQKQLYKIPEGLDRLPRHIVYTELQSKRILDAVADMRQEGTADKMISPYFFEQNAKGFQARILPRVQFLPDEFFISVRQMAFVDTLNTSNVISMYDVKMLPDMRIHFDYDLSVRSVANPKAEHFSEDNIATVFLRPLCEIDPKGFAVLESLPGLHVLPARRTTSRIPKRPLPPPDAGPQLPRGKTMF